MDATKTSPDSFVIARWVFARALGVVFFFAFGSLALQIRGLAGERGISPAGQFLDAVWNQLGSRALWQLPTLCWLDASDGVLVALCVAGLLLSLVLADGFCPGPCALVLWVLYLSVCWVATPFTNFQWDALLLETSLLAALYLPWQLRPDWTRITPTTQVARWLLWWLLFRLMFQSGVVKLASGDLTWHSLTALDFHFETQPLPIWTAWFVHQLPEWLLCLATAGMFFIEFVAPLFIIGSRNWRHVAAWALIALQVAILITGNYAFFNWLTIILCLLLFDDTAWPRPLRVARQPAHLLSKAPPLPPTWTPRAKWITGAALALIFLITAQPLVSQLGLVRRWPAPFAALREAVAPLISFNSYGLFAVMTTSRHEISVEGSDDGVTWREYQFRWKPDNLRRRPRLVAPYQPRLDWQMWFAALGTMRENPWFVQFLVRLLEGSPEVLALLRTNPFPDHPPRFVRAVLYDYHFTRFSDDRSEWWKREKLGLYCPPILLQDGRPTLANPPRP